MSTTFLLVLAGTIAGAILAIAGIAAGLWLWRRRRAIHSPSKLLRELCRQHGLNSRQRSMLARLAREQSLAQPALLFVQTEPWDAAQAAGTANVPELQQLRQRLFAR